MLRSRSRRIVRRVTAMMRQRIEHTASARLAAQAMPVQCARRDTFARRSSTAARRNHISLTLLGYLAQKLTGKRILETSPPRVPGECD